MMRRKKKSAGPGDKFTWGEGDIEIIKPGAGPPLLSEADLDRIIAENRRAPGDRFGWEYPPTYTDEEGKKHLLGLSHLR